MSVLAPRSHCGDHGGIEAGAINSHTPRFFQHDPIESANNGVSHLKGEIQYSSTYRRYNQLMFMEGALGESGDGMPSEVVSSSSDE